CLSTLARPPSSTLFPYTTLFRSLGLWAGPAYLIGRAAAPGDQWVKLAVALLAMWAMYPVSQLSSLSASSVWVPLNLDVFARLARSEEHTSELQSQSNLVCRLLLE